MSAIVQITPLKGLMNIGQHLAQRAGLGGVWHGDEGIGSVLQDALRDAGVPESIEVTPRSIARAAGLTKRKRRAK